MTMPNLTLSVDEETIKLTSVAQRNDLERKAAAGKLKASFKVLSRDMGPRKWTRESVYER
jgi:hypothetical protein